MHAEINSLTNQKILPICQLNLRKTQIQELLLVSPKG